MCDEIDPKDVVKRLNSMVGEPHEGCLKFLKRALKEIDVEIEGTEQAMLRDGRKFRKIEQPEFGAVVVFENLSVESGSKFHVGLMLDRRWVIQSSRSTNGVARAEISRHPWASCIRGFYKPVCF